MKEKKSLNISTIDFLPRHLCTNAPSKLTTLDKIKRSRKYIDFNLKNPKQQD